MRRAWLLRALVWALLSACLLLPGQAARGELVATAAGAALPALSQPQRTLLAASKAPTGTPFHPAVALPPPADPGHRPLRPPCMRAFILLAIPSHGTLPPQLMRAAPAGPHLLGRLQPASGAAWPSQEGTRRQRK